MYFTIITNTPKAITTATMIQTIPLDPCGWEDPSVHDVSDGHARGVTLWSLHKKPCGHKILVFTFGQ